MKNYGNRVEITFTEKYKFKTDKRRGENIKETLRNITEIHYNYKSIVGERIAFESDIHQTGITYPIKDIKEFEATLEDEKAEKF